MRGGVSVGARGGFSSGSSRGGAVRGGGYRGGFRGIGGYRGFGFRGYYGYPYYYPGFYGGFYDPYFWDTGDYGYGGDYGNGYADPGAYPSYPPQGQPYLPPSPQVLIVSNQTPLPPALIQGPPAPAAWDSGPTAQSQKYQDTLFLLAMNDGTIRAVLAYWVDGATVHYVTMDHEQKQAPLSSLDRSLSQRLNRERNVAFSLPG